ncbi:hypothetical protein QQF64_026278 [Cirrhinus molitorella]|uniref:Uncharacterized protein n=1 Tax=Cirrhinus molitorella TaxID=172907 RepID=A0ABR3NRT9_9TELE
MRSGAGSAEVNVNGTPEDALFDALKTRTLKISRTNTHTHTHTHTRTERDTAERLLSVSTVGYESATASCGF